MNPTLNKSSRLLALLITAILTAGPALADPPEGKGKGKGHDRIERAEQRQESARERNDRSEHRRDASRDDERGHRERVRLTPREGVHFADQHRAYIRDYHVHEHRRGFCPPGLAKKNNGCMPPGHAKRWQIGRPLERDIIYYDLPPQLVVQIGLPPAGHRYVRVAADILLIAVGTGLVIDAITDLGRM